jgi:AcrR family transcriptional regulator
MAFQRARNEKQVEARRLEIRKAVEKLYSDGCLANVTFTNISKLTSISRPAIYKYHTTREEVMLDMLQGRVESFRHSVIGHFPESDFVTREEFCKRLLDCILQHEDMLRLMAVQNTVLETNVRFEKLVEYKQVVMGIYDDFDRILGRQCPENTHEELYGFEFALLLNFCAIFPFIEPRPMQRKATRAVKPDYEFQSFERAISQNLKIITLQLRFSK